MDIVHKIRSVQGKRNELAGMVTTYDGNARTKTWDSNKPEKLSKRDHAK